jgi:hypothetical protein
MIDFVRYSDALLSALKNSSKDQEIIAKKQDILDGIYGFHNFVPSTTLFFGFSPALLSTKNGTVSVTCVSQAVLDYLDSKGVAYTHIPENELCGKKFDVIVAMEEFFTFATNEMDQQNVVKQICNLASEFVVSTLRDYKNQDFKDREFSIPAVIRNGKSNHVYNEFHDWDFSNRSAWNTTVYEIANPTHELTTYGPFARRTMYFKQLAKFSMDAGASDFVVHKNLMYKSLIKKNYEHVISIRFEDQWNYQNSTH